MQTLLTLITIQALLGALDNIWHHEITERLPSRRSARFELTLHTMREFLYAVIFILLAWFETQGAWAVLLGALFTVEIFVTICDFLEEDRTRSLPPFERVLHTVLAINAGCILAVLMPYLYAWFGRPTLLAPADYGILSWILTVFSIGVLLWAVRDLLAVISLGGPPEWKRRPLPAGEKGHPRTILVTGATGFIGKALCHTFIKNGEKVIVLTRNYEKAWNLFGPHVVYVTDLEQIDKETVIDAIIALAGAPVAGFPWTLRRRKILLDSRLRDLEGIRKLVLRLVHKPAVLVNASAIGYYGVRGDEIITESCEGQEVFQSQLCTEKETAALQLQDIGVRVCNLRIGLVFDKDGGAFPLMMRPIRYGLGAVIGDGRQWISWIYKADLVRVVLFTLSQEHLSGPINATSPGPLTNFDFNCKLAKWCHRPLLFRIPAELLRLLLGEMSQLFVDGQRVVPEKLLKAGFRFNQPTIEDMLNAMDGKTSIVPDDELRVFFNNQCPICSAEISHYRGISASGHGFTIKFKDINSCPNSLVHCHLGFADIKRRMYVRDEYGRVLSGIDAFIAIWQHLPGYERVARWFRHPLAYAMGDITYEYIIVPVLASFNAARERIHTQGNIQVN